MKQQANVFSRSQLYAVFKYTVYLLLTLNILLFFQEEWLATTHTFAEGISLGDIISGFAATIDTAAWVLLLLLFELETWVITDEKLQNNGKWLLLAIRAICYVAILYAFYGYCSKMLMMESFIPTPATDLCQLVGSNFSYLTELDQFVAFTSSNCATIGAGKLYTLPGTEIYSNETAWHAAYLLAWVDVINSAAWLLVVVVLEVDVWMQLRYATSQPFVITGAVVKGLLYLTLLAAAIYWGLQGDFLDFWDAFLWLVAFVFIEMNIFAWQEELLDRKVATGDRP